MTLVPEVRSARCERSGMDLLAADGSWRTWHGCESYSCVPCGRRKAAAYAQLAAASQPERFVTLTKAPEDFGRIRTQVRDFTRRLRASGARFEAFWVVEQGEKSKRGSGALWHVHMLQHGDYVPWQRLAAMWGGRATEIHRIKVERMASRYVLKEATRGGALPAAGYVSKGALTDAEPAYREHMRLNGGRAAHWTRGYFRVDGTDPISATAYRSLLSERRGVGSAVLIDRDMPTAFALASMAEWEALGYGAAPKAAP